MPFDIVLRDNGASFFDLSITSTAVQIINVSESLSVNAEVLSTGIVAGAVNITAGVSDTAGTAVDPSINLTMYLAVSSLVAEAVISTLSASVSVLSADQVSVLSDLINPVLNLTIPLNTANAATFSPTADPVPGVYLLGTDVQIAVLGDLDVTANIYILVSTVDAVLDTFLPGISGTTPVQYFYPGLVDGLAELLPPGLLLIIVNEPVRVARDEGLLSDVEAELANNPTIMLANRAKPNIA